MQPILIQEVSPIQVTLIPKVCPVGFRMIQKKNNDLFYKCECNEDNNEFIDEC